MKILDEIRRELENQKEEEYRVGAIRFFKEEVYPIGVRAWKVREISKKIFKENLEKKSKKEIFDLAIKLLNKKTHEESLVAFDWMSKVHKEYQKEDLKFFEHIVSNYMTNWHFCDDFCFKVLGKYFATYPEDMKKVEDWVTNKNRWYRRVGYVSLIPLVRKNNEKAFKQCLKIYSNIFNEKEDIVQKGCGWLLKDSTRYFGDVVYKEIIKNKNHLPRTTLRIAIEKMDSNQKKEAMSK